MAYAGKFLTGFSLYNTQALAAEEWTSVGSCSFTTGNNGIGYAMVNPQNVVKTLPQVAGWQVALGVSIGTGGGVAQEILRITDLIPNTCLSLRRQPSGKLRVVFPTVSLTYDDTVNTIPSNTYIQLEVGYFQSGTVGRLEVRYNGSRIAALTSNSYSGGAISNPNTGAFVPAQVWLVNADTGPITYDYVQVRQDTAAWADSTAAWFGTVYKGVLRPNLNGTYATGTTWAKSGGGGTTTDYYLALNETVNDHDTSYCVYNGTPAGLSTDRLSVGMQAVANNTSLVKAICSKGSYRVSPSGTVGKLKPFIDTSSIGGQLVDGTEVTLDSSGAWRYDQQNWDVAYGSTAWTPNLLSSTQVGVLPTSIV